MINLVFLKIQKNSNWVWGQDTQATVSSSPGVKIIRPGVKILWEILPPEVKLPIGILTPGGQAAQGSR